MRDVRACHAAYHHASPSVRHTALAATITSGNTSSFLHVRPQVGSEFAVGPLEQQRQVEALITLDAVLTALAAEEGGKLEFRGLNLQLYHPDAAPMVAGSGMAGVQGRLEQVAAGAMATGLQRLAHCNVGLHAHCTCHSPHAAMPAAMHLIFWTAAIAGALLQARMEPLTAARSPRMGVCM